MNIRIFSILFALPFIQFADAAAQEGDAQLPDVLITEDFESGAGSPKDWRRGSRIKGVKYKYDKKQGASGERSLSIQKSVQRYFPVAQWSRKLKHDNEKTRLKISAQIKAEEMTKAVVDITFVDEDKQPISHEWVCYVGAKKNGDPPADHDWKEYSGAVEIPNGTARIELAFQVYGPGKVWIDDLQATYVDGNATTNVRESNSHDMMVEVAAGRGKGNYLYVAPSREAESGNALLIVLPGGDGSADFHPFVSRIHANSLERDFALAQPIAKKWTPSQEIVWPTETSKTKKIKYTTEELIEATITDVGKKIKLNPKRIYILAWSSGGPAAYAALLQENTSLAGGVLAMSVFKPDQLPNLKNGQERSFYLLHSPDDRVCPFWMAEEAKEKLSDAHVRNTLIEYRGGHGWHGDVFGNIQRGFRWLEKSNEVDSEDVSANN